MATPRFIDAADRADIPTAVDVLIIGSGPTGSAYARTIASELPSATILMVEAGPRIADVPGEHVKNIKDKALHDRAIALSEGSQPNDNDADQDTGFKASLFGAEHPELTPVPGTYFIHPDAAAENREGTMQAAAMSTNVGGMGAHWGGATPHPRRDEREPGIPDAEWEDVLAVGRELLAVNPAPRTTAAEWDECLRRIGDAFDSGLPDDGKVTDMPMARQILTDGTEYWTGSDTVLGPLAAGEHEPFAIVADTACIQLNREGDTVTGAVLVHRPTGTRHEVHARVVVVAGDSFRTPQLLWASGIRPDALGRHLNEHLMVGAIIAPDYLDKPADASSLFSDSTTLLDMFGQEGNPSEGAGWIPYSGDAQPLHGQFAQSVYHEEGHGRGTGSVVFGFFFAKDGRPQDRLVFREGETDALGLPAFDIEYSLSERDLELRDLAHAGIKKVAAALGDPDAPIEEQPSGMSLHYMGTVRMGTTDDGNSVCDTESRVWGQRNLFLGGNGVVATRLGCNPTLTSVSLAVRGARAVARLLREDVPAR